MIERRRKFKAPHFKYFLSIFLALAFGSSAWAGKPTSEKKLKALKSKLNVQDVDIIDNCVDKACSRRALDRLFQTLSAENSDQVTPRILQLGDSHLAADYISGKIRNSLQKQFGKAGRGFTHSDQRSRYGGRRLKRAEKHWKKKRHVDLHRKRLDFGFSGISLESKSKKSKISYRLDSSDSRVTIYFQPRAKGGKLSVLVDGEKVGTLDTANESQRVTQTFTWKKSAKVLTLRAHGPRVTIYGLSFETGVNGIFFDSLGPVGADAKLYTEFGKKSFNAHLRAYKPDLIILMVGGNDAMKIRKGWTDLKKVENDHRNVIQNLRNEHPQADCMIWSPMDAGKRRGRKISSRAKISEVAAIQARVAKEMGCAYWDLYAFMGGEGSVARWSKAGLMNKDLIHPKRAAADLIGQAFSDAFLRAYKSR
ncbi:MAG: GDSL-type esterase/lipase family protein [Myxococcota bacterium]|nr:GDSL-type esterase/lipase family protein [Myxococcota bacterium]